MAVKVERQYSVRDDKMLDAGDRFHAQYVTDKADYEGYNIVMYPPTYGTSLKAKIDAARAVDTDNLVIDEMVEETVTVESKMKECGNYFQKMKPVIESVFPNNHAVWNQFGFNDYKACHNVQGKMIMFMDTLFKTATNYSVELIAGGFTAPKIAAIETLANELRDLETDQEVIKKERPLKTQTRINLYNEVWAEMQKINRSSKAIYMGNYAKLNQYELPAGSNAGEEPIKGEVPDGVVVNVIEMEFTEQTRLKLKNTGAKELVFCMAPDAVTGEGGLKVPSSSETIVNAAEIGSVDLKFLNVYSNDTGKGSFEVWLVLE